MAAAAVALPPVEEIRADSYVGFDTITQQIEHKLLKRGFQFNIIVVGMRLFYPKTRSIVVYGFLMMSDM